MEKKSRQLDILVNYEPNPVSLVHASEFVEIHRIEEFVNKASRICFCPGSSLQVLPSFSSNIYIPA